MQEYDSSAREFDLGALIAESKAADALPAVPPLDDTTVPLIDVSPIQQQRPVDHSAEASAESEPPMLVTGEPREDLPDVEPPSGLDDLDDIDVGLPSLSSALARMNDTEPAPPPISEPVEHEHESFQPVPVPDADAFPADDFPVPVPAAMPEPVPMADWMSPEPVDDSGVSDPFVAPVSQPPPPANETTYNVTVESPDELRMFDEIVDRMGPALDQRDRSIGFTVEEALDMSFHLADRRNRY